MTMNKIFTNLNPFLFDEIETKRCFLHRIKSKDFDFYYKLQKNEAVRKFLGGIVDDIEIEKKFSSLINSDEWYYVIEEKESKQTIGLISLTNYYEEGRIELSYEILPDYFGKGYAFENVKRVIDFALLELGIIELVAETQISNEKSVRLLERLGMKREKEIVRYNEKQAVYTIKK